MRLTYLGICLVWSGQIPEPWPDSDFDILVVTKVADGESAGDYDALYAPIKGLGVGCDVVPRRADEFGTKRNDPTSLCWHVVGAECAHDSDDEQRDVVRQRAQASAPNPSAAPPRC